MKFLLDYENIYFSDVSFIDSSDKPDFISCLSYKDYLKLNEGEDPWNSNKRKNVRAGRFFKKIIIDNDQAIEELSKEYKFSFLMNKDQMGRLKMSKGIEIAKWYLENNYAMGHGGTLRGSCMRHVKSQRRLPIYITNPHKIRMLYLLDSMGKLMGRALIWKLDEPGGFYMDRIYYTEDYVEKLFLDYAKSKGYITYYDMVQNKKIKMKIRKARLSDMQRIAELSVEYGKYEYSLDKTKEISSISEEKID
jgi:hypothetical protein